MGRDRKSNPQRWLLQLCFCLVFRNIKMWEMFFKSQENKIYSPNANLEPRCSLLWVCVPYIHVVLLVFHCFFFKMNQFTTLYKMPVISISYECYQRLRVVSGRKYIIWANFEMESYICCACYVFPTLLTAIL